MAAFSSDSFDISAFSSSSFDIDVAAAAATTPSGAPGSRRKPFKFNGKYYDKVSLRLKRDIEEYNSRQAEVEKKPEPKPKPKPKKKAAARIELPAPEPYTPDLEMLGVVNALRLRELDLAEEVARIKRLQAEIDEDNTDILLFL